MRYSPGYGDVDINIQEDLLDMVFASKRVGVSTSRSGMLIPTKSITAFIGISSQKENRMRLCSSCSLSGSCEYRKRGDKCGS